MHCWAILKYVCELEVMELLFFATSACTSFGSGETRDYTVLISRNLSVNDYGKESGKIQVYPNPVKIR